MEDRDPVAVEDREVVGREAVAAFPAETCWAHCWADCPVSEEWAAWESSGKGLILLERREAAESPFDQRAGRLWARREREGIRTPSFGSRDGASSSPVASAANFVAVSGIRNRDRGGRPCSSPCPC